MVALPYNTFFKSSTITASSGGASADVIYTVPPNHDCVVTFMHVSNGGSSTTNVTVQVYTAVDTTYHHLLDNKSIAGNDVYSLVTSDRIYLHAGDKVVAFGGGGALEITASGEEHYNPNRR